MILPVIDNFINSKKYEAVINNYAIKVNNLSDDKYDELFNEAYEYNKNLTSISIIDAFTSETKVESTAYENLLKINDDGVMGYIKIPKINVEIPYLVDSDKINKFNELITKIKGDINYKYNETHYTKERFDLKSLHYMDIIIDSEEYETDDKRQDEQIARPGTPGRHGPVKLVARHQHLESFGNAAVPVLPVFLVLLAHCFDPLSTR